MQSQFIICSFSAVELWLSFWSEVHYNSLYELQGQLLLTSSLRHIFS